ncbi:T9SS type A sorting domain-containing protein [Psychroserpens mesophilus]|uniref:T9SS type A sorting domain-containing protein n=1 Tax=Psychroserpens mesophilus TaxID=325473 RepID=UPI0009FDA4A9|nr:T9SS type A sorting domain-containing protein [Psychroserpens mesophilus]
MRKIILISLFFTYSFLGFTQVIDSPAYSISVECDGNGNMNDLNAWLNSNGGATASSTCGNVIWSNDFTTLNTDSCDSTTTVVFTAIGNCGLETTIATFSVFDSTAPVFTSQPTDLNLVCSQYGFIMEIQYWAANSGIMASDECGDVVILPDYSLQDIDCDFDSSMEVTFTATDDCGNSSSTTAFVYTEGTSETICPQPSITFNSQAELDAFPINYPDCNAVEIIWLNGSDIVDLTPLSQFYLLSSLFVENTSITDFSGLENLVFLSEFTVINNDNLINFNGLSSIENITEFMVVRDNDNLQNFVGMNSIEGLRDVIIENNQSLTNFAGLESANILTGLSINNNDSLLSLNGLNNIENSIFFEGTINNITIQDNDVLENLNGLSTFINKTGSLIINDNAVLNDISVIDNIAIERDNPANPAPLQIQNNPFLSVCNLNSICNYLSNEWNPNIDAFIPTIVVGNASGCASIFEVLEACQTIPFNDNCVNSINLELGETLEAYNNLATTSDENPSCNDTDRADVWFAFNSESNTSVDIIVNSEYNIQLWEGSCGSLTHVPDSCLTGSLLDFPVSTNSNYFIQVWTCNSCRAMSTGQFDILVQDGTLTTADFMFNSIDVFPNPVINLLFINSTQLIESVEIYNLLGQKISESFPRTKKALINFSNNKKGIYFLTIKSFGAKQIFKVVKD